VYRVEDKEGKNTDINQKIEYLFHPKSIAIVGVSPDTTRVVGGRVFLNALINYDYKGRLYLVNRGGGEVHGLKLYDNVKDIPDTVDYVISAIPATFTPQLLLDCASKGVKAVHIFSAGFSEITDKKGDNLESQIKNIVRQTGIRVIGPNCMGLYYPKTRLTFLPESPTQSGPVGFMAQSGLNSNIAILEGSTRGVYFSKAISYGNACDLNECDFLEYFMHDPETKIIAGYIEGAHDGDRFIKILKEAAAVKPVILYKAGNTDYGAGAVASHTGTLAGSNKVWEGLLKQAGVIQVYSMEELLDAVLPFIYMSPPKEKNLGLIGMGGGGVVQAADECAEAGLRIPPLPLDIRQKLEGIYNSETGASFRNPVDIYWIRSDLTRKAIEAVAEYELFDLLLMQITLFDTGQIWELMVKPCLKAIASLSNEINHRTAISLRSVGEAGFSAIALEEQRALAEAGFAVFPSAARAANAIIKFMDYHQRRGTAADVPALI